MEKRLVWAALVGFGLVVGCGDDHSHDEEHDDGGHHHDEYTEACQAIIDVCHEVDPGEGEIFECHAEWAHENMDDKCVSEGARCIALCEAAAADAGHGDAGQGDAGEHH